MSVHTILKPLGLVISVIIATAIITSSIVSQPTTSANPNIDEAYLKGYTEGYISGTKDGAGTGYNIRDPTYAEMKAFILSDRTDLNTYNIKSYNCYDFTQEVCNNAFNQGYRAGNVYIEFAGERAHGLVCFDTVDRGLVFIEPQTDNEVNVTLGVRYFEQAGFTAQGFDDTIIECGIIW